jgi:hypothetical protein
MKINRHNHVFRADGHICGFVSCKVIGQQLKNDVSPRMGTIFSGEEEG